MEEIRAVTEVDRHTLNTKRDRARPVPQMIQVPQQPLSGQRRRFR